MEHLTLESKNLFKSDRSTFLQAQGTGRDTVSANGDKIFAQCLSNAPNSSHDTPMAQQKRIIAKLYVVGPFGVYDTEDRNRTPRGKKSQALLALLALAPRAQRTRVWLRDKLWSMSDEKKSSTSLRQTLFEIRRDLGEIADTVISIDRHTIGLNLDHVWVDQRSISEDPSLLGTLGISRDSDLLEGIDIADEEFEDWLTLERQIWVDKMAPHFDALRDVPARAPERQVNPIDYNVIQPIPTLGFLPNIQQGCDASTLHVADHLLEGIAKNLRELISVSIFDLRTVQAPSGDLIQVCDAEFLIRVRTLQIRDTLTLTFFLYRADQMSLEWSQSIQASVEAILNPTDHVLISFMTQNVDRLAKSLDTRPRRIEGHPPSQLITGYAALNMMFRLDDLALANSEKLLASAHRQQPDSLYTALQTYASSFKVGENLGIFDQDAAENIEQIARTIFDENPFNSISLACLGHTMGYVFRDHNAAQNLFERALNLNPNQALVWDHYALHKLYIGEYEASFKAAKHAVSLGTYSPLSFSYETTLSMAATLVGDHNTAIYAGQNALRKQPKFSAAMRYLLFNYSALGRVEEAEQMYQKLLTEDPDFQDKAIQKERFRLSQKSDEDELLTTLNRYLT